MNEREREGGERGKRDKIQRKSQELISYAVSKSVHEFSIDAGRCRAKAKSASATLWLFG